MEKFLGLQLEYLLMLQNFREVTHGAFDWILYHITLLGEYCFAMLLIALFYWVLNKKCGIYLVWNFFGALVVNQFLKVTACIYRPWILDNRIHPLEKAMKHATGYSFPSGHTAIATGTFGALAVKFWSNKILRYSLITMVFLIAFSRNYLCVHTPQDVVVSMIVGVGLLYVTSKVLKWIENGKKRDLIAFGIILILCILLIIYTEFKHYPVDYLNGVILVEPEKMRFESFPKAGFALGAFTGWLLERRFVNFDAPQCGFWGKALFFLFGGLILVYLQEYLTPIFLQYMSAPIGRFSSCFLIGLYITVLYPLVIHFYNKKFARKID